MVHNNCCTICDDVVTDTSKKVEKNDDISFAALLALVPAMTLTLFSLMGLI
ncbi:MAG: hypothetical protein U9Q12_02230 [Patescibacteria group bacterium]|nr:hypothetical protein [Patescibacteria group bacterium]